MSSPRNTVGHGLVRNWGWLDAFANFFGAVVGGFYKIPGTHPIKSFFHGTWPLRHPLHPAITDFTVGGYTVMVLLDIAYLITGEFAFARAADVVLVLSFLSSLVAILSGLTDWNETFAEERRTGMLHGLLMVVASVGFIVSLWLRVGAAPDARASAIAIGIVSWAILTVSAYFGGEMVFGYGTEVNRQAWVDVPADWQRVDVIEATLKDRAPVLAKMKDGFALFVVKLDGKVYAMGNTCTHAGGPLNEGKWVGADRCEIQCPWHASRFCVKDGGVRGGPATFDELSFEVRAASDGRLEVRARS